jgi:4-hydroxybenzoate polyprenyltransferase
VRTTGRDRARPTLAGLVRACHPLPSLAVTVFTAALGVGAGLGPGRTVLLAAAVLAGQLSIGWCNDAVDGDRDVASGRAGKPVVAGLLTPAALWRAASLAVLACVPLSLALGAVPGVVHLVAVASGWAYDLRLKATVASPLPYLVSFAALPVIAATAAGHPPPVLTAVAAGVLGVAAHFANTVPDAAVDARTGVAGLPQRIGPDASRRVAATGVVAACGVLLVGAGADLPVPALLLLGAAALVGALGGLLTRADAFRLVLAAAALAVAGVVVAGPVLLR